MGIKYDYPYGFCKHIRYNGLWPVKYEGQSGNYRKVEMSCTCGDGKCKDDCEVFNQAVDIIAIENEWLLKDELMGS